MFQQLPTTLSSGASSSLSSGARGVSSSSLSPGLSSGTGSSLSPGGRGRRRMDKFVPIPVKRLRLAAGLSSDSSPHGSPSSGTCVGTARGGPPSGALPRDSPSSGTCVGTARGPAAVC